MVGSALSDHGVTDLVKTSAALRLALLRGSLRSGPGANARRAGLALGAVFGGGLALMAVATVTAFRGQGQLPEDLSILLFTVLLAGAAIPRIKRSPLGHLPPKHFATQAVVGSKEETLDLSLEEMTKVERLLAAHQNSGASEQSLRSRAIYRSVRPATRGLLLIYPIHTGIDLETPGFVPSVAISFPYSQRAKPLSYTVAETWRQQNGLVEEPDADAN